MLAKQLEWQSSKSILFFLLFFFSANLFSMSTNDGSTFFHNYSHAELDRVYGRAPSAVTELLTELMHSRVEGTQERAVVFTGPSGTGKTSSAIMFAYKLKNLFSHTFVHCTELTCSSARGATVEALRQKINDMVQQIDRDNKKGGLVILDDIEELLEHPDNILDGELSPAGYLAKWLEDQRTNNKVFLIATCINDKAFPADLESCFLREKVRFTGVEDPELKKVAFLEHMDRRGIQLDASCNSEFLNSHIATLEGWVGMDFYNLTVSIVEAFLDDEGSLDRIVVNKDQVARGIQCMQSAIRRVTPS